MNNRMNMQDIIDSLNEIYEYNHSGKKITYKEVAEQIGLNTSQFSKLIKGTQILKAEEAEKIAEFYDVPIEVITGKMNIEDIPAINKDGLSELKFLSRKWIYDNSHCEDTKYRVEMLNLILSNSKCADLFFDTLSAFVNGFFIGTNSLQYAYSKSEIEHILFKGFILEELDEFFKNLYKRTSIYRENRVEEKINEIFERMKQSKEILKQSRLNEETQELEMIHQENEDMKNEINNIN